MKNLLKSGVYFMGFVLAGVLFQISCSNSDNQKAANITSTSQLNKIIFTEGVGQNQTIWVSNYDGTGLTQIPITLPSGVTFNGTNGNAYPRLSPDGTKVFFVGYKTNGTSSIYSCDITGSNLLEIYNTTNPAVLAIGSAN
jgi:hypothetical protein